MGIFTIVVLMRDSVVAAFSGNPASVPPPDSGSPIPQRQETGSPPRQVLATAVLHAVLLVLAGVFFVSVVPRYLVAFHDLAVVLPVPTRITITFSRFLQQWGLLLFPFVLGTDAGICFAAQYLGGRRARRVWSGVFIVGLGLGVLLAMLTLRLPLRNTAESTSHPPLRYSEPTVKLEFCLGETTAAAGLAPMTVAGSEQTVYLSDEPVLSNADVQFARVVVEQGRPRVEIEFTSPGAQKFAAATERSLNKPLGILVDGRLVSAPIVKDKIVAGRCEIRGHFTAEEAVRIAEGIVARQDDPNDLAGRKQASRGHADSRSSATGEPTTTGVQAPPVFGPVIERALPSGAPCQQQFFQFRNGEMFVIGNGPATTKEEFERDWEKVEGAGGADVRAECGENGIQLVGHGCIFARVFPELKWDICTAEQAVDAMKRVAFSYGVVQLMTKDLPITYLFKTSRGEVGIMQVLGVVEDERASHGEGYKGYGMKFRYRLVLSVQKTQDTATPTAWTEQPLRLEIELVDGTTVIGTPSIKSLPVHTSGVLKEVPLGQLAAVKIAEDHETSSVDLQNGDTLKGVINLASINLNTASGQMSVDLNRIKLLCVVPAGDALPDALRLGLVLYYSFDRDEEGKVTDRSRKRNHGEVTGAKWTARGKVGGAYEMDGRTSQIQSVTNVAIEKSTPRTIAGWIRCDNIPFGHLAVPIGFGRSNSYGDPNCAGTMCAIGVHSDRGTPTVGMWGVNEGDVWSSTPLSLERWYHVAATYDGETVRFYRDGELDVSKEVSLNTPPSPLAIGRIWGDYPPRSRFVGAVDEVMVFNRALTPKEVWQLRDAQIQPTADMDAPCLVSVSAGTAADSPAIEEANLRAIAKRLERAYVDAFNGRDANAAASVVAQKETQPAFAIYLSHSSVWNPSRDPATTQLATQPLLTEKDLVSYDWTNHTMRVTTNAIQKLPVFGYGLQCSNFVVVANGQRCYVASFIGAEDSAPPPQNLPLVRVCGGSPQRRLKNETLRIEIARPLGTNDSRYDQRIYDALNKAGKLIDTKPGDPNQPSDRTR